MCFQFTHALTPCLEVGIGTSQIEAMASMIFITMQIFAEDELGQSAGPDLFRNQEEITFYDRIVQLEGLISIAMTGSAFAVKVCGDQLVPRNRIGWFTAHLEIDHRIALRVTSY